MPWVRLDDHFDENPKVASVGPAGIAFYVVGLAYCNRNLTDGFIPWAVAQRLVPMEWIGTTDDGGTRTQDGNIERLAWTTETATDDRVAGWAMTPADVIDLLLTAGLWEHATGGYRVHDYSDFQPTKAQVMSERESAKARMAGVRANKRDSSGDVQANIDGSSPYPVPVPTGSKEPVVAADAADAPKSRSRRIAPEDVTRWEGEHPTVDIPAMVKDYENWTGSAKHKDKVLGFENQLREEWRLEKFRKRNGRQVFREEGIFAGTD